MKIKWSLFLFAFAPLLWAQIPANYYSTAVGTGYTLKTQLHNIIDDHNDQGYGALWDLYTTSAMRDYYYENDGTLLDIYSEKPFATDSYEYNSTSDQCGSYSGEGSCYNREHLLPQSVFNEASPMKNDAHFVVPSDGYVNGQRGSYPFGVVGSASWTSTNGSKKGNNLNSGYSAGYTETVFEPIDEFKGDVARALFYFATRYEDQLTSWNYEMFNGTSTQVFTNTFLNILLAWNTLDPVSDYEIAKNNEIYYNYQTNRNPFIDHPEWVNTIWNPSSGVEDEQMQWVQVFPNPAQSFIQVKGVENIHIDSYVLYNMMGQKISEKDSLNEQIDIQNLEEGVYFIQLRSQTTAKMLRFIVEK